MVYCANCGAEIQDLSQNFCEKCGSSIPTSVKQGKEEVSVAAAATTIISPSTMGFQPYDRPGGLFDINRNYYILKEK
ncbi:MAG: zinc ribbon domain-containing protein [Candidatus Lokiarchaeota archaeon]|nr:zinc ribbon domain-containing protein [Candidatus Lokiarchaeota archaeon]